MQTTNKSTTIVAELSEVREVLESAANDAFKKAALNAKNAPTDKWIKEADLLKYFNLKNERHLRSISKKANIKSTKAGRTRFYLKESVETYLDNCSIMEINL